eukprot:SAG11_NODE_15721_length_568_cov_1.149254_1_plen_97_part_10
MAWNLHRLADALAGRRRGHGALHHEASTDWLPVAEGQAVLREFEPHYSRCLQARTALRLGLPQQYGVADLVEERAIVAGWQRWLQNSSVDYHLAGRG